jgi:hypothetical protein
MEASTAPAPADDCLGICEKLEQTAAISEAGGQAGLLSNVLECRVDSEDVRDGYYQLKSMSFVVRYGKVYYRGGRYLHSNSKPLAIGNRPVANLLELKEALLYEDRCAKNALSNKIFDEVYFRMAQVAIIIAGCAIMVMLAGLADEGVLATTAALIATIAAVVCFFLALAIKKYSAPIALRPGCKSYLS